MTNQQKEELQRFISTWSHQGKEVGDKETYWNTLLRILGVPQAEIDDNKYIKYEYPIHLKKNEHFNGSIDAYIPSTRVLIEQKSFGVDLDKPENRPNGKETESIKPFEQAKRYSDHLGTDKSARYIVLCNFAEIWIYYISDNIDAEPIKLKLKELPNNLDNLMFLVKKNDKQVRLIKEKQISLSAGHLVSKLYKELSKIFAEHKIDKEVAQKSINTLCVRLVFCLYAEDSNLFAKRQFHDYLAPYEPYRMARALKRLFKALNTKKKDRLKLDPFYLENYPYLSKFPYVNGGMFRDQDIIIPPFTPELKNILLNEMSLGFNWSKISPTIFGAVFESTLNPETRRQGGMHYTSVENIHKVIDPLFLNDLAQELKDLKGKYKATNKLTKRQTQSLKQDAEDYQNKLANLTFLDPACGSGNFLTETYLSLRKLENEVIRLVNRGGSYLDTGKASDHIKVSIQQFYGIEINDFAVSVAKTALWIAEDQMWQETQDLIAGADWDFLPLHPYTHIKEGNALRMDWDEVINADRANEANIKVDYIIGNPPFVGPQKLNTLQKEDRTAILGKVKRYGMLDYVTCWYAKATKYVQNTKTECAFVSTNSICQGSQVPVLWPYLIKQGIHINFAYRSFKWINDAKNRAQVICIIIGFSLVNHKDKYIYDGNCRYKANNISPYLTDSPTIFVEAHSKPICNVPKIMKGLDFSDGGNYIFTKTQKNSFLKIEPKAKKYFRKYYMGKDFLYSKPRYCLWLKDASPKEIRSMPAVLDRVKKVKQFRENAGGIDTSRFANQPLRPTLLRYFSKEHTLPALAIPRVSAPRDYIPMAPIQANVICGDKIFLMEDYNNYLFAILESKAHTIWTKMLCGRLGKGITYSNTMIYNNFPFPDASPEQKEKISKTAQAILDARAKYPDSSLADLYDPLTMPIELRKAHEANDKAVLNAYGLKRDASESEIVACLFKMYEKLTAKENN